MTNTNISLILTCDITDSKVYNLPKVQLCSSCVEYYIIKIKC